MKTIAVIGGGIFGVTIALELSKVFDVTLFERELGILWKASGNNHFRHHYGFHYPRSKKTALESIWGRKSFEKEYGTCILGTFPNFYSIMKEGSLTTPEDYLQFCDDLGLWYEVVEPNPKFINKKKVDLTIKVKEPAFDPVKLQRLCNHRLERSSVKLKLKHELIQSEIVGDLKYLNFKVSDKYPPYTGLYQERFDYVIGATYANFNQFNTCLGLPVETAQYELMELIEVEIPGEYFGCINMDGPFSSVLPKDAYSFTVAHVYESVLKRINSNYLNDDLNSFGKIKSNSDRIMSYSEELFPILKKAKILKSRYITKVVKSNVDDTDERCSEVKDHGNGIYSVFAGKVITCVDISYKISRMIKDHILQGHWSNMHKGVKHDAS